MALAAPPAILALLGGARQTKVDYLFDQKMCNASTRQGLVSACSSALTEHEERQALFIYFK